MRVSSKLHNPKFINYKFTNNKFTNWRIQHIQNALIIAAIVLMRVIPHWAGAVPVFALLAVIASSKKYSKIGLIVLSLMAFLISDVILSAINHYPIIGLYSLFMYSGLGLVIFCNHKIAGRYQHLALLINSIQATLLYWLWTNFGVWLLDNVYSFDMQGFCLCYSLALPFLQYALISNCLGAIVFGLIAYRFSGLYGKCEKPPYSPKRPFYGFITGLRK